MKAFEVTEWREEDKFDELSERGQLRSQELQFFEH